MALAETARLIASLELKDKLSPGVASATKGISTLQTRFSGVTGGLSKLGSGLSSVAGRIKNLVMGPLGMLGMGAGLLGIEQFLKGSIDKATAFGDAVIRMSAATGLSAETTSALVSALSKYGIDGDRAVKITTFMEKAVGNLMTKTKTVTKFEEDFGFKVRDASGHVKDANQLILTAADYFTNKHVPAVKKAAAMAKLFGRGWADLIPVLKLGSQGIKDAEQEAKDLGLTVTKDTLQQLKDAKEATRRWDQALGGLKLQIGLALMPHLKDLADWAAAFVKDNSSKIVKFFKDAADFAAGMGHEVATKVLPAIRGIIDVWNKIPSGLQQLLIGGFVVNKLTGGAVTGLVGELGKGLIKGVLGMNAGVVNVNAAVVNGGVGGAAGAGGVVTTGGGAVGKVASLVGKVLIVGFAAEAAVALSDALGFGKYDPTRNLPGDQLSWPWGPKNTPDLSLGPFEHLLGGDSILKFDTSLTDATKAAQTFADKAIAAAVIPPPSTHQKIITTKLGAMPGGGKGGKTATKDADAIVAIQNLKHGVSGILTALGVKIGAGTGATKAEQGAITARLGALKAATSGGLASTAAASRGTTATLARKDFNPTFRNTVNLTSTITVRGANLQQSIHASYNQSKPRRP